MGWENGGKEERGGAEKEKDGDGERSWGEKEGLGGSHDTETVCD